MRTTNEASENAEQKINKKGVRSSDHSSGRTELGRSMQEVGNEKREERTRKGEEKNMRCQNLSSCISRYSQ